MMSAHDRLHQCRVHSHTIRAGGYINNQTSLLVVGLTVLFPEPVGPMTLWEYHIKHFTTETYHVRYHDIVCFQVDCVYDLGLSGTRRRLLNCLSVLFTYTGFFSRIWGM